MSKRSLLILAAVVALALLGSVVASAADPLTPQEVQKLFLTGERGPTTLQAQIATKAPEWAPGAPITTPTNACYRQDQMQHEWGTWPYQQNVREDRYWCANYVGGPQNYRVSHVFLHSALCNTHGAYGYLVDGGNGFTWATVHTGGYFDCPTPVPYVILHSHGWQEWACNTWGNCALQRSGRDM